MAEGSRGFVRLKVVSFQKAPLTYIRTISTSNECWVQGQIHLVVRIALAHNQNVQLSAMSKISGYDIVYSMWVFE